MGERMTRRELFKSIGIVPFIPLLGITPKKKKFSGDRLINHTFTIPKDFNTNIPLFGTPLRIYINKDVYICDIISIERNYETGTAIIKTQVK